MTFFRVFACCYSTYEPSYTKFNLKRSVNAVSSRQINLRTNVRYFWLIWYRNYRIRIRNPHLKCGSGTWVDILTRIHEDPSPKHPDRHSLQLLWFIMFCRMFILPMTGGIAEIYWEFFSLMIRRTCPVEDFRRSTEWGTPGAASRSSIATAAWSGITTLPLLSGKVAINQSYWYPP